MPVHRQAVKSFKSNQIRSFFVESEIRADVDTIRRALQLIYGPTWARGGIAELRALGPGKKVRAGYFDADHLNGMVDAACRLSGDAAGVYCVLNTIEPGCLGRAANRIDKYSKNTTRDVDISHRNWLLIDIDACRPSGVSSTESEHQAALKLAAEVRESLAKQGWPKPIMADSGNGAHLLYRVDLPADDGNLVKNTLKALAKKHDCESAKVDTSVHNPARISKLYGTQVCKGDDTSDRPHRLARLLDVPQTLEVVPRELLEFLANEVVPPTASKGKGKKRTLDVRSYLESRGVKISKIKELADGGMLYELEHCPFRPGECDGGAFVIQRADGSIYAGCHHYKCEEKTWEDMRDVIDPGWRDGDKGPSVPEQIIRLAAEDEFFHTADNEAFVTILRDGHRETWRLKSKQYKLIIRARLHGKRVFASDRQLDEAIALLERRALFEGPECQVHLRIAQVADKIYLDLCNSDWEVVETTPDGWRVLQDSPVRFIRKEGMLPLPRPVDGGQLDQAREFINVSDEGWHLAVAWIMGAFSPDCPKPILILQGEQGSCKSTSCRMLRALIDPHTVAIRNIPKDIQTYMIWAGNSYVMALDNLSSMSVWLSDAMCRLSTGGGHSERALYTDDSEKLFFAIRPQMINGIGEVATRSDFLDRSLIINCPVMPRSDRRTEKDLNKAFEAAHPAILGAILTAASHGLKRLPDIEKMNLELPRLADFARWMLAVETGLGWPEGTFRKALSLNETDSHESVVSNSVLANAIRKLATREGEWTGTWQELQEALKTIVEPNVANKEPWFNNNRTLSNKLRERAPNLRGVGIDVSFLDTVRPKRVAVKDVSRRAAPAEAPENVAFIPCYGLGTDEDPRVAFFKRLQRFWALASLPSLPVATRRILRRRASAVLVTT